VADDVFETIRLFLPKYLAPQDQRALFEELRQFPYNKNFYWQSPPEDLLQGDGWRGLVMIDFYSLEKRAISGVIVSNSCDIDVRNPRTLDTKILFAPLIKVTKYRDLLSESGSTPEQIEDVLSSMRAQKITSIFHLPALSGVLDESFASLDDLHAHPLKDFSARTDRSRLFALNQYAFYLFLLKLSTHFSRFQEGVTRIGQSPIASA
jgi:hypothetical protein